MLIQQSCLGMANMQVPTITETRHRNLYTESSLLQRTRLSHLP